MLQLRLVVALCLLPSTVHPFYIKNITNGTVTITLSIPDTNKTDVRVLPKGKIIGFTPTNTARTYLAKGGTFSIKKDPNINKDMSNAIDASTIDYYFVFGEEGASICANAKNLAPLGQPLSNIFDGLLTPQYMTEDISAPWCTYPE